MVFKDRAQAGKKLFSLLKKDREIKKNSLVVISLLRGGVILGDILSKKFRCPHLGLVVVKIPAPLNPELAIGALCFDVTYVEKSIIDSLKLRPSVISEQIKFTEHKFIDYCRRFDISESLYDKVKNKKVILVDDGIATGASSKTALLFLKTKKVKKVFLASPVSGEDMDFRGFDKTFILQKDPAFGSVSQFYENFPQIEDEEVKRLLDRVF